MKAIYQTEYGKSDVLKCGELNAPKIGSSEMLIKNFASSINPRDWMIREGRYQLQFLVPKFPLILGSDFAGEVVEVGSRVRGFSAGDKVFGMKNPSEGLATHAAVLAVPSSNVAHMPAGLSFNNAAGVPLCALTAWQALQGIAHVRSGQHVLVVGASGGVGSYAVQIANALGANVTAVCSESSAALMESLGVKRTVDYKRCSFIEGQDNYDIIFDTIGRHSLSMCKSVLNDGGIYVSTIPSPKNLAIQAYTRFKSVFFTSTKRACVVMVKSRGKDLQRIADLISKDMVRPVVDSVFPMAEASSAHDLSRSRRAKGKIILEIRASDQG